MALIGASLVIGTTQVGRMLPGSNADACPVATPNPADSGVVVVGANDCIPRMPPVPKSIRDRELFVVVAGWSNLFGVPYETGVSINVSPPPLGMTERTIRLPQPTGHWYGVTIGAQPGDIPDFKDNNYRVLMGVGASDATHKHHPNSGLACGIYRLTTPDAPENSIVRANFLSGEISTPAEEAPPDYSLPVSQPQVTPAA